MLHDFLKCLVRIFSTWAVITQLIPDARVYAKNFDSMLETHGWELNWGWQSIE